MKFMSKEKKVYKRPFLRMVLAFILYTMLFLCIVVIADIALGIAKITLNGDLASSLTTIAGALIAIMIFYLRHRKNMPGFFTFKSTGSGLLMGWSLILVPLGIAFINIIAGMPFGDPLVAVISGLAPGLSEEIIFRIIPLSFVKSYCGEKKKAILATFIFTGILFGAVHGANLLAGSDLYGTAFQVLYAVAVGLLLAGIYLRTGNIWTIILLHSFVDIMSFMFESTQQSGGIIKESISAPSVIVTLAYTAIFYINAIMVFRKNREDGIL